MHCSNQFMAPVLGNSVMRRCEFNLTPLPAIFSLLVEYNFTEFECHFKQGLLH
jgi:hypothetical protein